MDESISVALTAVLAGDVACMPILMSSKPDQLTTAATGMSLVLSRDAVVRVLAAHAAGRFAADEIQAWASFVRRGYVAPLMGPAVSALQIDWDSAYESAIAEALGRLDELGDVVDGELHEEELAELIRGLSLTD